jgi:spore coat protein U-like protein
MPTQVSTQKKRVLALATLLAAGLSSAALQAATVTGSIDSTITLEAACEVNADTGTTGVDFGSIDFGTHSTLFTEADAQVLSSGTAIEVLCSPGVSPTFTITSGVNDANSGSANHAMSNGTLYVPYSLYTDAGRNDELALSTAFPLPGTADGTNPQTLELYARAFGQDGLTTDTYTDILSVQLDF